MAPFVSWVKCSVFPEINTVVFWKNIQERFDEAKNRIDLMKQTLGSENPVLQQAETLFEYVNNIWLEIASKVNLESNIIFDIVNNPDVRANDYNIAIMQLYEVGLLCDMEQWIRLRKSENDCLVFCRHKHVKVLKNILLSMNFKVLS